MNSFNVNTNAAAADDAWRAPVVESRASHGQASAAAGDGGLPNFDALTETLRVNKQLNN